jgi:hypothetical protein
MGSNCVHIHFLSHPFPNIPHNSCKDLLVAFPKSKFQYGKLTSGTDSIAPDPVRFETPGDVLGSSNLTRHQSTMSLAALPSSSPFQHTNPCLLARIRDPRSPNHSSRPCSPHSQYSPAPVLHLRHTTTRIIFTGAVRSRRNDPIPTSRPSAVSTLPYVVTDPGNVEQDVDISTEALAAGADDGGWGWRHQ